MHFPPLLLALALGFLPHRGLGVLGRGSVRGSVVGLDFEVLLLLGVVVEAWECRRHGCREMSFMSEIGLKTQGE